MPPETDDDLTVKLDGYDEPDPAETEPEADPEADVEEQPEEPVVTTSSVVVPPPVIGQAPHALDSLTSEQKDEALRALYTQQKTTTTPTAPAVNPVEVYVDEQNAEIARLTGEGDYEGAEKLRTRLYRTLQQAEMEPLRREASLPQVTEKVLAVDPTLPAEAQALLPALARELKWNVDLMTKEDASILADIAIGRAQRSGKLSAPAPVIKPERRTTTKVVATSGAETHAPAVDSDLDVDPRNKSDFEKAFSGGGVEVKLTKTLIDRANASKSA